MCHCKKRKKLEQPICLVDQGAARGLVVKLSTAEARAIIRNSNWEHDLLLKNDLDK